MIGSHDDALPTVFHDEVFNLLTASTHVEEDGFLLLGVEAG